MSSIISEHAIEMGLLFFFFFFLVNVQSLWFNNKKVRTKIDPPIVQRKRQKLRKKNILWINKRKTTFVESLQLVWSKTTTSFKRNTTVKHGSGSVMVWFFTVTKKPCTGSIISESGSQPCLQLPSSRALLSFQCQTCVERLKLRRSNVSNILKPFLLWTKNHFDWIKNNRGSFFN